MTGDDTTTSMTTPSPSTTSTRVLTTLKALITSSTLTRITTPPSWNRHSSETRQYQLATLVHPPLVLALALSIPQGTYEPTEQEQMEPESPRPLLLGERTIPASKAQKRCRRENMRNLDAGDKPQVNPSFPQTRRQHRFPRPYGMLDLDGGCAGSDGNPITSAETKMWNLCTRHGLPRTRHPHIPRQRGHSRPGGTAHMLMLKTPCPQRPQRRHSRPGGTAHMLMLKTPCPQ
jgi:hypothetical protein